MFLKADFSRKWKLFMEMENLARSREEIKWEKVLKIVHQYLRGMATSSLQSPGHKENSDFLMAGWAESCSDSKKWNPPIHVWTKALLETLLPWIRQHFVFPGRTDISYWQKHHSTHLSNFLKAFSKGVFFKKLLSKNYLFIFKVQLSENKFRRIWSLKDSKSSFCF